MRMEELTYYVLSEMQSLEGISSPLKTTNRIKYSCFTASKTYLVFGATSGGIYVFKQDTCTFMHLLPNKEGAISHISVSPDEKWFGFATIKGVSCVLEHSSVSSSRRIVSCEHEGTKVTALQWNPLSSQLYVGDELGRISIISTSAFLVPTVTLMQLDSQIVQLDCYSQLLLASTLTRSYLCDTYREQYRQIGSRARDGKFGGCFYSMLSIENSPPIELESGLRNGNFEGPYSPFSDKESFLGDESMKNVKMFCTRPGLRLWEVHVDGTVTSTHQFKRLQDTPPTGVIRPPPADIPVSVHSLDCYSPSQTFTFATLHLLASKFLFTFYSNGICVLDPVLGDVVLWTDTFKGIKDISAVGHTMFIWQGDFQLHSVNLSQLDQFLVQMYFQKQYSFCANLCVSYFDFLSRQASSSYKLPVLCDLLDKLKENNVCVDRTVYEKISDLLKKISLHAQGQQSAQLLNSGIFVVGNAHYLAKKEGKLPSTSTIHEKDLFQKTISLDDYQKLHEYGFDFMSIKNPLCAGNLKPFTEPTFENPETDDFDPFADLPLSALTSPETVAALKQISNTVSETITSGTKTLKEKWQYIEEKMRPSEPPRMNVVSRGLNGDATRESGLSQNADNKSSFSDDDTRSLCSIFPVDVSIFENLCKEISSYNMKDNERYEDVYADFVKTLVILYDTYRKFMCEIETDVSIDTNLFLCENDVPQMLCDLLETTDCHSFPFREFFNTKIISDLDDHFHSCFKSGALVCWLQNMSSSKTLNLSATNHPSYIKSMFSSEDLVLDRVLGKFIQLSKYLLNPNIVLDCLDSSKAPCQFQTWSVIVDCFNRGPVSDSIVNISDSWPLPCLLNALLIMLQLGQIESCHSLGMQVPVKHVLRLILKLDEQTFKMCHMCLTYLDKLPLLRLQNELKDVEVFNFTKFAFEVAKERKNDCHCECGFPIQSTKPSLKFNRISFALILHLWETNDKSSAFKLCQSYSLWSQLLSVRQEEDLQNLLPLMLQAGCIDDLKSCSSDLSEVMWQQVFELQENLMAGNCLGCDQKFHADTQFYAKHWSSLATILVQGKGSAFALDLVSKFSHAIPAGILDLRFYQSCLLTTVAESHRKGSGKPLIDTVLYSSELPCMSSKLAEKIADCTLRKPGPSQQNHWGLHVKFSKSNCLCCLLPLNSPRLLEGWGIVGFKCSHAFHTVCLVQSNINNCPVCVQ